MFKTLKYLNGFTMATAAFLSIDSSADEYQSFLNASYNHNFGQDSNAYYLSVNHYFSSISNVGPYGEFDFLIPKSNLFASYNYTENDFGSYNSKAIGGNYYYGNFVVGGSYLKTRDDDLSSVSLGYLLTPELLVSLELPDSEFSDSIIRARYQHDLSNSSYVGVQGSFDSDGDTADFVLKYLTPLSGSTFLSLSGTYNYSDEFEDFFSVGASYYFNLSTSLGIFAGEDNAGMSFSKFFSPNLSISSIYSRQFSEDLFNLSVAYQF